MDRMHGSSDDDVPGEFELSGKIPLDPPPPRGQLEWAGEEPPPQSKWVPVVVPKVGVPVRGVFINPYAVACYVHWNDFEQVTVPHLVELCYYCQRGQKKMRKAFMPFLFPGGSKLGVLQISSEAWRALPNLCRSTSDLRGYRFLAKRIGERRCSRMSVEVYPPTGNEDLPAPIDVREILLRLWGMNGEDHGI